MAKGPRSTREFSDNNSVYEGRHVQQNSAPESTWHDPMELLPRL